MSNSPVDEIKSKLSVEEVISGYLQLQRAGRNWKALCPFHSEKTPSFIVSPERQIWHCFGCNEGGDIFTFVMKMEGLEFRDALKVLAERAGVELKNVAWSKSGKKGRVLEILDISRKFYQECLKIKEGRKAFEYLLARGLTEETIEKFQLGYAPNSWDLLSRFLKNKGYKENEIFAAGMTIRKDGGGYYDRFRGRIMFPINNISGRTVGFSARIMPGADESQGQAKYINTPETEVYNKRRVLYGLDKAKVAIRREDLCIIVEGNMDVIASFQAGVENVVAASGTALTLDQIKIIKRYTNNIAFSFDIDSAGIKAANRGIEMALSEDVSVKIVRVPEGKDPADCVKSNPDLWRKAVMKPEQIMDFYFDSVFSKYDSSDVEGKKRIAQELLGVIGRISNKIEQTHYLQILSKRLNVDEKILAEALVSAKRKRTNFVVSRNGTGDTQKKDLNREIQLQRRLLGFAIVYPHLFGEIFAGLGELFSDQKLGRMYSLIENVHLKKGKLDLEDLQQLKDSLSLDDDYTKNEGSGLSSYWDDVAFEIETEMENMPISKVYEEAKLCVRNLKKAKLQKELKDLEADIKKAERENDYESQELLMNEFNKLVAELGKLDAE